MIRFLPKKRNIFRITVAPHARNDQYGVATLLTIMASRLTRADSSVSMAYNGMAISILSSAGAVSVRSRQSYIQTNNRFA